MSLSGHTIHPVEHLLQEYLKFIFEEQSLLKVTKKSSDNIWQNLNAFSVSESRISGSMWAISPGF